MFYKLQNGSRGDSSVTSVINSEGDESPGLDFFKKLLTCVNDNTCTLAHIKGLDARVQK